MSATIAYIAGFFPLRSETFVYREVRELRKRGWNVVGVSLRILRELQHDESLADLHKDVCYVYEPGWTGEAALEFILHPIRGLRTLFMAIGDAISPGEPTSARDRLKTLAQCFAGMKLAADLRTLGVSHIHCHFAHAPAAVGMYAARQLEIPFSFTGHANDLFQRRHLLKRKLQRARFVACISEWHREFYRTIQSHDRYIIVRCGIPMEGWTFSGPKSRPASASSVLRVLTVGRLVEKKGVDMLVRAMRDFAAKTGRPWKLTVAGDGPEREKLQALVNDLGVLPNVEFLGAVRNEDVPKLLAEADIFALPCRTDTSGDKDGIPVVLMEAMACGTPVIAGNLDAIRELVEDHRSGLLVDGTDVESIAEAIARLVADTEMRERLARAARERIESEFSLAENVTKLEKCFRTAETQRSQSGD